MASSNAGDEESSLIPKTDVINPVDEPESWTRSVRAKVGLILFIVSLIVGIGGVVGVSIDLYYFHNVEKHTVAWFSSGCFVVITIPVAVYEVAMHLTHWYQPVCQRHVVRILWMVPIYATCSWLSMRYFKHALYFNTIRESYEAYVIYNFIFFLIKYLGDNDAIVAMLKKKEPIDHLPPFCCVASWKMGREYLRCCKLGVLQYVLVRAVCTLLTFIGRWTNTFGDGEWRFDAVWPYVLTASNISQVVAMYCLVMFYKACREELEPIRPIWKFASVKAIVFFTFWQSVFVEFCVRMGWIHHTDMFDKHEIADGIINYAVSIEMLVAAVMHSYIFSYRDYLPENPDELEHASLGLHSGLSGLMDALIPSDLFGEIGYISDNIGRADTAAAEADDPDRANSGSA